MHELISVSLGFFEAENKKKKTDGLFLLGGNDPSVFMWKKFYFFEVRPSR